MSIARKFAILLYALAAIHSDAQAQDNYAIKQFQFEGVRRVSESALREALATRVAPWYNRFLFWRPAPLFSVDEFQLDLQRIVKFYEREGFFHARIADYKIVPDHNKQQVRLSVRIEENEPTRIAEIKLAGMAPASELPRVDQLFKRLTLKIGDRLSEAGLRASRTALITDLTDHGYPNAQVKSEIERDATGYTAKVLFRIDPGAWCVFGTLKITGNEKIATGIIRDEMPIRSGEPFSQSKLLNGQQQIYRLALFQSVSVRALSAGQDSNIVPIEVRVREAPLHTLKIGVGYGTEERLRATINYQRRNFLGDARRLESEVKYSDIEPGKFQIRVIQPHFFDSQTDLILSPFYFRQEEKVKTEQGRKPVYKLSSFGGELAVQRQLSAYHIGAARYRLEDVAVDTFRVTPTDSLPKSYRKSLWGISLVYNNSRPLFSPHRGRMSALYFDYSDPLSDLRYVKTAVEGRVYSQIEPGWVMAYRLKLGALALLESNHVAPVEERFYAGGSTSVRGWSRLQLGPQSQGTPIGGQSLLEGSIESRFQIKGSFGAAVFADFGQVWLTPLTYKLDDLHYAAGFGLRYHTPIGPIRFDAAAKLNKQPGDQRTWEFYLSVGQAF